MKGNISLPPPPNSVGSSDTFRAGRTVKIGFVDIVRSSVRYKFAERKLA